MNLDSAEGKRSSVNIVLLDTVLFCLFTYIKNATDLT